MTKACPIESIVKRNGMAVDYNRDRIETAIYKALVSNNRPDRKLAAAMALQVENALISTYGSEQVPSVEDVQDVVESVLMENGLTQIGRSYIIYRHERAMARAARAYQFEVTDSVPYRKLYEMLVWNMEHQCGSVRDINRIIARKRMGDLVNAADRRYAKEIETAARLVAEHEGRVRVIIVAGPSSSGKTTTTIKLGEHLTKQGRKLKALNIDNYFFDLEQHPRDEFGDYDYETPQALDLDLINRHLEQLLAGRTVRTPHYNFKTGRRALDVHETSLGKNEILVIDSLHGLYADMTRSVAPENKFRLYIETLGQLKGADGTFMRWADNRLLRRMMRDKDHRNLKPMDTLTHWHYVRRSELTNIIPFVKSCDAIVNSALPYELPILKHRLFRYISRAKSVFHEDPKRLDAHIRASRVYDLLKPLKAVSDDSCVPPDSLLREFIGGSRYGY